MSTSEVGKYFSACFDIERSVLQIRPRLWPLQAAPLSSLLAVTATLSPLPRTPPAPRGLSASSASVCPRAATATPTPRTPTASVRLATCARTAPASLPSPPAATVTPRQTPRPPPAPPGRSVSSVGVCPRAVTATPRPRTLTASVRLVSPAGTASVRSLSLRAVSATRSPTIRTTSVRGNSGVSGVNVRTVPSPGDRVAPRGGATTRSSTRRLSSSSTPPSQSSRTRTPFLTWQWEWLTGSWRITSIFRGETDTDCALAALHNLITTHRYHWQVPAHLIQRLWTGDKQERPAGGRHQPKHNFIDQPWRYLTDWHPWRSSLRPEDCRARLWVFWWRPRQQRATDPGAPCGAPERPGALPHCGLHGQRH